MYQITESFSSSPSGGDNDRKAGAFPDDLSETACEFGRRIVANDIGWGIVELSVEMITSMTSQLSTNMRRLTDVDMSDV